MKAATDHLGLRNKIKNDKFFWNYKIDNVTAVEIMNNQSKKEAFSEGQGTKKESCSEKIKTDINTAGKLEQNKNEGAVDIVVNKFV